MSPKIIVSIIVIFCLIQGNHSESLDDVIATLTSQIAAIKANIDFVIRDGGIKIRQTRAAIGQAIDLADSAVQEHLDDLDDTVQQAMQEAQIQNTNISDCVDQVSTAVSHVEVQRIQNCTSNHDFDLVGTEFGNLRIIKKKLSRSIHLCLRKNPQNLEGLKACVKSDVDGAKKKIDAIQEKIDTVCDDAKVLAKNCIDLVVKDLNQIVSKVSDDFKACVSGIL